MTDFVTVASRDDVPEGGMLTVEVGSHSVIVVV